MSTAWNEFGRELDERPMASDDNYKRYKKVDRYQNLIRVGDDYFPLQPLWLEGEGVLSNEEVILADSRAIHWREGRQECERVEDYKDLSSELSAVQTQRYRRTCVAFASLAGLEHALRRFKNLELDLSEEYANWMFMMHEGADTCREYLETKNSARYLAASGVCTDNLWPYLDDETITALPGQCPGTPPLEYQEQAVYGVKDYVLIAGGLEGPRIGNTDYLECLLSHGYSIVVSVGMAIGYDDDAGDGVYDLYKDSSGNFRPSQGGHAMLLTGYDRNKRFFMFKNSWGPTADHDGYIYLSYNYFRYYAKYGFVITEARTDSARSFFPSTLARKRLQRALEKIDRRYYVDGPDRVVEVELPRIPRNKENEAVILTIEALGDAVEARDIGVISNSEFLLPPSIKLVARQRGIVHLILTARQSNNDEIPGLRSAVMSVAVGAVAAEGAFALNRRPASPGKE